MQTGQTNTGSHGPKAPFPMSGSTPNDAPAVGALKVGVYPLPGTSRRLVKVSLMSLSVWLDAAEVDALMDILEGAREVAFR